MAVSPVVVQHKTEIGVREGKRMSIPMRTQENGAKKQQEISASISSGKELAEQLNEETKKKYVKSERTCPVVKPLD